MSPANASSTSVRSWAKNWSERLRVSARPVRTCCTSMPRSKRPEQMRVKAMRSRCFGSMFAWILNTKAVNSGEVGLDDAPVAARARGGGGAKSMKQSRNGSTPKLFMALPKNTGRDLAGAEALAGRSALPATSSSSSLGQELPVRFLADRFDEASGSSRRDDALSALRAP